MAFAAQLEALTGELVAAVTGLTDSTDKNLVRAQSAALRTFKNHRFLATNDFQVQIALSGLQERFRINNRDSLADELESRLDELHNCPFKWHAETLRLLLELSDQPTYNTRLCGIVRNRAKDAEGESRLRWEDIAREDGWAQDLDIWDSIDYSDKSLDEAFDDSGPASDVSSNFGSEVPRGRTATDLIIQPQDNGLLKAVVGQQEWKLNASSKDSSARLHKVGISETQALREILFMLQGLPTTLFDDNGVPDPAYQISNMPWQIHKSLLNGFSEAGGYISILRGFVTQREKEPQLQALQDCVAERVRSLDNCLILMQKRFANPAEQVVVSLIAAKEELIPVLEPLYRLSGLILKVQQNPMSHNFRYLELLFDESSMAQLTGDMQLYGFLARIFLECFSVYLREIRSWVEDGRLLPSDEAFFICNGTKNVPLGSIWQHRFKLRRTENDQLLAPKFVHPSADKIYMTGKSIVILRLLRRLKVEENLRSEQEDQMLTFECICPPGLESAPFPDLFIMALDQWIARKYTAVSVALKTAIFDEGNFEAALNAFHRVYLMSDGAAASSFCERLFESIDRKSNNWYNRRALTTFAQEAFAGSIDASRLAIGIDMADGEHVSASKMCGSVMSFLPLIKIIYRPEWPLQMIIDEKGTENYRNIFTFLLQIKRAAYSLRQVRLLNDLRSEYAKTEEDTAAHYLFYSVRSSLVWFCDTLQTYLTTVVLMPQTSRMHAHIRAAPDVDGMHAAHERCVRSILDQMCLGGTVTWVHPVHDAMLDVLNLAVSLDATVRARYRAAEDRDSDEIMDGDTGGPRERYVIALRQIRDIFSRRLRLLCDALRGEARTVGGGDAARWDALADMLQPGHGEEM